MLFKFSEQTIADLVAGKIKSCGDNYLKIWLKVNISNSILVRILEEYLDDTRVKGFLNYLRPRPKHLLWELSLVGVDRPLLGRVNI